MYHVWSLAAAMYIGRGMTIEEALYDARSRYPSTIGWRVRIERGGAIIGGVFVLEDGPKDPPLDFTPGMDY